MRRTLVILPVLLTVALIATIAPVSARAPIAIGVSSPDNGGGSHDVSEVIAAVDAHTTEVGRKPRIWSIWSKWGDRGADSNGPCVAGQGTCAFPTEAVKALHARGIMPMIWWVYVDPKNHDSNRYGRYRKILDGKHTAYIKQWAKAAKAVGRQTGKPIIVRMFHEATGTWFPWSVGVKDNTMKRYRDAWNYVGRKFRRVGADPHVRWLWSNVTFEYHAFPGERYVDYVGWNLFNFGTDRKAGWTWPRKKMDKRVAATRRLTKKPIIIAEMGTHYKGGDKGDWIKRAYTRAYDKHPKIRAMVYLETEDPHIKAGHPDWRLHVGDNGRGLKVYRNLNRDSRFKGRIK